MMNLQNVIENFQTFNNFARNPKNGGLTALLLVIQNVSQP